MTQLVNGDCEGHGEMLDPCPCPAKIKNSESECLHIFEKVKLSNVEVTPELKKQLRLSTFSNWSYSDDQLIIFIKQMFIDLGFTKRLDIDSSTLENFLFEIYRWYNKVPFHNFKHCFMVTQMAYTLIWMNDLQTIYSDLELLSLLTASICHDLDHPGLSNFYQRSAKTVLATRYSDISPLENHHISQTFHILSKPQCNIFKNLSESDHLIVRECIIRLILATDMARHCEIVEEFQQISGKFDFDNLIHRELLLRILIKTADISNEARPFTAAEKWIDCLLVEFFQEAELEKSMGIEPLPNMDPDKVEKSESQCNFISKMILPMYEILSSILPAVKPFLVTPCKDQLNYYTKILQQDSMKDS